MPDSPRPARGRPAADYVYRHPRSASKKLIPEPTLLRRTSGVESPSPTLPSSPSSRPHGEREKSPVHVWPSPGKYSEQALIRVRP